MLLQTTQVRTYKIICEVQFVLHLELPRDPSSGGIFGTIGNPAGSKFAARGKIMTNIIWIRTPNTSSKVTGRNTHTIKNIVLNISTNICCSKRDDLSWN